MPIYYHIHRSMEKSAIENNFKEGKRFFFSKKNSFWHDFEKTVALQSFDGYSEYKITIPQKYFTYSLKPRTKNKILKLTPKNIKEFIKLHEKYTDKNLVNEYINKNFIGIDATHKKLRDLYKKLKYNPHINLGPSCRDGLLKNLKI